MVEFNYTQYYDPMLVIVRGHNEWQVCLPLRAYGKALSMRLCSFDSERETHKSLGTAFKRIFRAKQMVKAFKDLPIYLEVRPEGLGKSWMSGFFELVETESDAMVHILTADSK
jgi:hypothetical protein